MTAMTRGLDVVTSWTASVVRLGAGYVARPNGAKRPAQLLELYEWEACPFCRRVREALSELDLEAMIIPCPRGGRNRQEVIALGGKTQFPFLVDPNTGMKLYESEDIIRYLADTYGDGRRPLSLGPLSVLGAGLASVLRPARGRRARAAEPAKQPLVLYGYEASPYCRLVRERLCELQLRYHLINVAKRSAARAAFVAKTGRMMVPYLEDPNTGRAMFESAEILDYLEQTYAG